jgi:hypothetical protein
MEAIAMNVIVKILSALLAMFLVVGMAGAIYVYPNDVMIKGNLYLNGSSVEGGKVSTPMWVDDPLYVTGTAYLNRTKITQVEVSGPTFLNSTTVARPLSQPVNATQTLDTVITATNDKSFYPIDASGSNVTWTAPLASAVTGRSYKIMAAADPGSYYIRITATGGSLIRVRGGAAATERAYLVSTDTAPEVTLTSDGTRYWASTVGTWAQHAA